MQADQTPRPTGGPATTTAAGAAAYGASTTGAGAAGTGATGAAPGGSTTRPPEAEPRARAYDAPPGGGTAHAGNNGHGREPHSPAESFKAAFKALGEIKEYAGYLVGAKLDGIKLSLRNVAIFAALGILGLIVGGGLLITAAVLLLNGLADAIAAIPGFTPWLGNLIVGLLILGGTAAAVIFGLKAIGKSSRKRTVAKYETRKRDQRVNFGHDVTGRALERAHEQARNA